MLHKPSRNSIVSITFMSTSAPDAWPICVQCYEQYLRYVTSQYVHKIWLFVNIVTNKACYNLV